MQHFILITVTAMILSFFNQEKHAGKQSVSMNSINQWQDTGKKKPVLFKKALSKEGKWNSFWKDFTEAINSKNKSRIIELTAKDFYDGGGGTVDYWMDSDVYSNEKRFNFYKALLKKGAKNFKGEGLLYKATGKNDAGDLFFEYKNEQWLFGGIVAD